MKRITQRLSQAHVQARHRFFLLAGRAADVARRRLDPGTAGPSGRRRRVHARHRRVGEAVTRFMDYGPDWPPEPRPPRPCHTLLRRCVAAVVLYALIWAVGSVLLELRLFQLRDVTGGVPVTTYRTVTGPHH